MPFDLEGVSPRGKVVLAVAALALGWIGVQSGVLAPVIASVSRNASVLVPLGIAAIVAWWVIDEADADDSASDAIRKTGDRAERATGGLLDSTAAIVMAVAAVLFGVGGQLVDLLAAGAEVLVMAPLAAMNVGTIGLAVLGALGVISAKMVVVAGIALLILGMVMRRRST